MYRIAEFRHVGGQNAIFSLEKFAYHMLFILTAAIWKCELMRFSKFLSRKNPRAKNLLLLGLLLVMEQDAVEEEVQEAEEAPVERVAALRHVPDLDNKVQSSILSFFGKK